MVWSPGAESWGIDLRDLIRAGTFHRDGGLVLWGVHNMNKAIMRELTDERYQKLIVEVADP
jgi:hypothetical protein